MSVSPDRYLKMAAKTRDSRMNWWREARFGMFVHWGLYAQLGRHEWVMNRERIPVAEYEKLAKTWKPKPRAAREWARLARAAGMKYMVMTTKHHEGFCLWDTRQHDYNAMRQGPGRDLVREYVEACREFGLKIGFYYSLMDWHHPDGALCATDENARRRFVAFTRECVRELLTNYGRIDVLWYDVAWPLATPEQWGSYETNRMARRLQPHIIINNRSCLDEDFGTPEESIEAAPRGRAWEACMTFNGSWGWQPCPPEDWLSTRKVLDMLRTCTAGSGNLLLNIGPLPDGSVPPEAVERLSRVGRWLRTYGEAVYGRADRVENMEWMATGRWTRKDRTLYYWCTRWPGRELAIGGLTGRLERVRILGVRSARSPSFEQSANRLVIRGLPATCPDRIAQVGVLAMKFRTVPVQRLGAGCVLLPKSAAEVALTWRSAFVRSWRLSRLVRRPAGGVAAARAVRPCDDLNWSRIDANTDGFVNVHDWFGNADGIVYLSNRFAVDRPGTWVLSLGHDGGARVFVDGRSVLCEPKRVNPATPGRSRVTVTWGRGVHDVIVALDTDAGMGWGIFFRFEIAERRRKEGAKAVFPKPVKK